MRTTLQITKSTYKISDFISWKRRGNLILSPYFQRRSVWKTGAKSYLIDTITRNFPIPIIFLRDAKIDSNTFEAIREVIDGQQRLRTIFSFIDPSLLEDFSEARDAFFIQKSHNPLIAGKKFTELDEDTRQSILNYEFSVHVLPPQIGDRDVIQIFRRMNSTNFALKKQEILNSQYFGEFKTSIYNNSATQLERWKDSWKMYTEDDISRMKETELVSEIYIAILKRDVLGKSSAQIEQFYKKYDETFVEREEVERRFNYCMDTIFETFDFTRFDFVFYKKTLFYTFFCAIYELLFGFETPLTKSPRPTPLAAATIDLIKYKSKNILERTALPDVLESTDRRTTNPKERKRLFKYILNK